MKRILFAVVSVVLLALLPSSAVADPLGTAFTYQGSLSDGGSPANGSYDLTFSLYDAASGSGVIAGPLTNSAVSLTNGLFTVTLDFGSGVFTGAAYWLEIAVCTNGSGAFTTLSPRQALTPTPCAIMANTASNLLGTVPLAQLPSAVVTNNQSSVILNGAFTGNGSGLTSLNPANLSAGTAGIDISGNAATATTASNVTGNIADSQLSANIPLLNGTNSFTGTNTLAGVTIATNVNNVFNGAFAGNMVGNVTGNLSGNASTATSATNAGTANNFSGPLSGDVTGTQSATVVSTVGGQTAANVASGASAANAATSADTANTIVMRDASGNFSAGTVTANLAGNAATASNVVAGIGITNAFITNSVFAGDGAGLTNLNASQLASGMVPLAQLPGAVVTNNQTSVTLNGTFTGSGANLTALNANNLASGTVPLAQLSGITSNQLDTVTWQLATNRNGGNAATATGATYSTNTPYGGAIVGLTGTNIFTATNTFSAATIFSNKIELSGGASYSVTNPVDVEAINSDVSGVAFTPNNASQPLAFDLQPSSSAVDSGGFGRVHIDILNTNITWDPNLEFPTPISYLSIGIGDSSTFIRPMAAFGGQLFPLNFQMNQTSYAVMQTNGLLSVSNLAVGTLTSSIYGNAGKLEIFKDSTISTESAGLSIANAESASGQELLVGVSSSLGIALIQSAARGISFQTVPLELNPEGGAVTVGNTLTVTNGICSYSPTTPVVIPATGWTNTWSTNNAVCYLNLSAAIVTIYNGAGTALRTNASFAGIETIELHPGWGFNVNGTLIDGNALPW
jgi:hypothetical protein